MINIRKSLIFLIFVAFVITTCYAQNDDDDERKPNSNTTATATSAVGVSVLQTGAPPTSNAAIIGTSLFTILMNSLFATLFA